MTDRFDPDELPLPPELAALDRELRSITYEERPSFGPELEAELEAAWGHVRHQQPPLLPARSLMAAGVAGLLMVALGVPSARASLARLVGALEPPRTAEEVPASPPGASLFYEVPATPLGEDAGGSDLAPGTSFAPPPAPEREPRSAYAGPEATLPRLLDREGQQRAVARNYPRGLLEAGIGGTVGLQLWVDSTGVVEVAHVSRSSGHPELDRAAVEVAPTFRFEPARRLGQPVGTWVEFPMVFEPVLSREPARRLFPERMPPGELEPVDASLGGWEDGPLLRMPGHAEAEDLLREALGPDARGGGLGPLEALLQGNPPPGRPPTAWRAAATTALEAALARDPDNPAPLLALARIRRKQGLPEEARALVERALDRATGRAAAVSPSLRAELHYERGTLLKERWRAVRALGWVAADALPSTACPAARSVEATDAEVRVPVARLIAWNYLCPERLDQVLETSFESGGDEGAGLRGEMLEAFRRAVRDEPAHTPARMEILLALADEGRWDALAEAARSENRVQGRLLRALAQHRLGRSVEAAEGFRRALGGLVPESAERLLDVAPLLAPDELRGYRATSGAERDAWRARYWRTLDPVLGTEVNEREVEHLARATYAELGLGGVDTDAGRVWLRYGDPDAIRVFHEGPGLRTEFWDYGQGPDLTFRRLATSGKRDLTSEGRAYVDELVGVFPHRYGPRGRDVYALDGDVTRFRGEGGSGIDLEIQAPVPSLFAAGARDSVEVGVFLLDDGGAVLTRARRRVSTADDGVFFRVAAPDAARRVVLEFLDREDGRAASLRADVALDAEGTGPAISDLRMTGPAPPDAEAVRRDAGWLRPLEPGTAVREPLVGAYFELYDVQEATAWYRVRAEAERVETGERRALPLRPAGEAGFRTTWDRVAGTDGPAPEFLGLSLETLLPGRWIVRVVVDFPLAGGPLVAERRLTVG